ncbi:ribosomal S17-domain-containing protein [Mycena leptocephala]|nr:ribosomal S17-domain-containing protein [Mycena leptocephala]
MTFVGHHTVADRAAEAAVGVQVICLGKSTGCVSRRLQHLTLDFHTNKCIIDDVAVVSSKQLHNKISGFTTHLLKRIQKGPVRGMSFKLQEEERERKDNYVPEVPLSTPLRLGDWRSTQTRRSVPRHLHRTFSHIPNISVGSPYRLELRLNPHLGRCPDHHPT